MRTNHFLCTLLFILAASGLEAREWKDVTGNYSVQADLVAYSDHEVILKRMDGQLVRMEMSQLSKADRAFLSSKDAALVNADEQMQLWTLKSGLKLSGRPVGYGRKEFVVQRRRGKIYLDDRLLDNLPKIYQQMIFQIVSHFENVELPDKEAFVDWVNSQKGEPRTFLMDGVLLEFQNGDEYTIPFLFFSNNDLDVLKNGWERWLAYNQDPQRRQQEDFLLQAQAKAYQRDRQVSQEIAAIQLILSAVDANVTDLWEVYLEPKPGVAGEPLIVVVPGRVSQRAVEIAIGNNPHYIVGAVRKLNHQR